MPHRAEMAYLEAALRHMRLQLMQLRPGDEVEGIDLGLRAMLGLRQEYDAFSRVLFGFIRPEAVYRLTDPFGCSYVFFALPEGEGTVLVGPYLTRDLSQEQVLELTERLGLPLQYARQLTDHYAALPVFADAGVIMALISAMGERLWGGVASYETIDLFSEATEAVPLPVDAASLEENSITLQMQAISRRYDYENEMMEAVSKGLLQRVEQITGHISQLNFEQRMADPLRNAKNYCIICNTLLRKAAERGGVHPLHIDRVSSQYAVQIENKATPKACTELIGEMFRTYCRLVRSHTVSRYPAPVQKALIYIEENLSGELGLQTLANVLELSPGYLSALFRQETGQTLTGHITDVRMKHAMHLLTTTQLQVQTVAQLCGIPDANYFTKLFRRRYGVTPRLYRREPPGS
ncbi:MAG: helix-turn-helix transcriptional regulator [Clostridiales bacterium]|nr:helix-turn-helix transcriptional regulator [Clostridiales bacterium]